MNRRAFLRGLAGVGSAAASGFVAGFFDAEPRQIEGDFNPFENSDHAMFRLHNIEQAMRDLKTVKQSMHKVGRVIGVSFKATYASISTVQSNYDGATLYLGEAEK